MATTRPFAYNTGGAISGTTQVGNLAVGVDPLVYSTDPGGVKWWMGPDEDLGYVIAYYRNRVPNAAIGGAATNAPYFWRSSNKSDTAFLSTANRATGQTFTVVTDATSWLATNGYWTNYPTWSSVTVGSQVWSSQNMILTTYRNGDPIPQVTDATTWNSLTTGAWCWYNNDSTNEAVYGKLYNWYALTDARGFAPAGWIEPTDTDWATLSAALGGDSVSGGKLKATGTTYWTNPNTGADNSSGFTALPAGYNFGLGGFGGLGTVAWFWSSTSVTSTAASVQTLSNTSASASFNLGRSKIYGASVRLLKV